MTKEELQKSNIKLENKVAILEKRDSEKRKEFAKAFGMYKSKNYLGYTSDDSEPKDITWEEIFVHVGGFLIRNKILKQEEKIIELVNDIDSIKNELLNDTPPKHT